MAGAQLRRGGTDHRPRPGIGAADLFLAISHIQRNQGVQRCKSGDSWKHVTAELFRNAPEHGDGSVGRCADHSTREEATRDRGRAVQQGPDSSGERVRRNASSFQGQSSQAQLAPERSHRKTSRQDRSRRLRRRAGKLSEQASCAVASARICGNKSGRCGAARRHSQCRSRSRMRRLVTGARRHLGSWSSSVERRPRAGVRRRRLSDGAIRCSPDRHNQRGGQGRSAS